MRKIWVLILSVICVQIAGRYYAHFWIVDHFYWLPFLLRFGLPLALILFYFRFSFKDLGLGLPQMSRAAWVWTFIALGLIPVVVSFVRFSDSYLAAYPQYVNDRVSEWDRILRFTNFTLSTFFSWAFLHRVFLLGGIRILLQERAVPEKLASTIAILWTASFEILYHLIKPDLEAWGLVLFAPLMCWMAVKTKSVWLPTFLHLYLEACFIFTLIFLV